MRQDVFSILYLEDEEKDREAMRALIESMETEAKKEGYIRLTMVFGSEDLFQVSSQTQYDLLILDMNLQERVSIEGWEILRKLRRERKEVPRIWVVSQFSHVQGILFRDGLAQKFFPKTPDGYEKLREELWYTSELCGEDAILEVPGERPYHIKKVPIHQIVSIEAHKKEHFVYKLNESGEVAFRQECTGRSDFLKKVLQEIETRKIRDLVQVSRTTIVNVRYIQQVIQENGNYKLVMVQYGQGQAEQIPVGRSFLKSLSWLLP